jgi:hypothetical protein
MSVQPPRGTPVRYCGSSRRTAGPGSSPRRRTSSSACSARSTTPCASRRRVRRITGSWCGRPG